MLIISINDLLIKKTEKKFRLSFSLHIFNAKIASVSIQVTQHNCKYIPFGFRFNNRSHSTISSIFTLIICIISYHEQCPTHFQVCKSVPTFTLDFLFICKHTLLRWLNNKQIKSCESCEIRCLLWVNLNGCNWKDLNYLKWLLAIWQVIRDAIIKLASLYCRSEHVIFISWFLLFKSAITPNTLNVRHPFLLRIDGFLFGSFSISDVKTEKKDGCVCFLE